MSISFDDIENAVMYVSAEPKFTNGVYLCKETGRIFYTSMLYDSDELPEDIEDPDKYQTIPHRNDLQLGNSLVYEFAEKYLPEDVDKINSFFHHRGAYSHYKDLLDSRGLLDKWHKFEDERRKSALEQWCQENCIEIDR